MDFNKEELMLIHVMTVEYKSGIYKAMRRKNCSYESSKFLRKELEDLLKLEEKFEDYQYAKDQS